MKKQYQVPSITVENIVMDCHLLSGSGTSSSGPSAGFMSNPGISGSRSSSDWDDEEEE